MKLNEFLKTFINEIDVSNDELRNISINIYYKNYQIHINAERDDTYENSFSLAITQEPYENSLFNKDNELNKTE